ncbi:uncharacterized protein CELE_C03B1.2 [Caenorhabditis elegans]|uniref:Uncharacterized protein C03B1.2 n=1 Tax=Caenorhabditis elegans TaxID=6239 RepID=YX02_CAEEL|nr:Uncharacterized protein CELE_C03B1.2 [Caenorhabditis elegans]Q11109.3 RecName: Full=Uncharacterized protein C03B1.2 [Caenorhabditis elegans]CCD62738.2 Uncharacterized protein CELE_C03B1.2 [Caenorhabditis elegans]
MEQLFQKYEKKLKLQNVQARIWEEKHTYIKSGKAVFKVPNPPKQERTFRWVIEAPASSCQTSRGYSVKFTPSRVKRAKIPERMYNMKRCFQLRRDSRIALSDAIFQPEKKTNTMDHLFTASTAPEYSEKELRQIEDFQSFFDNWDDDYYTEQDCLDLMQQAVNGRIEVYQEVYKQTSNPIYLAKAVFIKFLDFDRLSPLHKTYLMLSEECEFPMCYVEGILRRHYE